MSIILPCRFDCLEKQTDTVLPENRLHFLCRDRSLVTEGAMSLRRLAGPLSPFHGPYFHFGA
jgi:hypothetical protein